MLGLEGTKMSKSLGNLVFVHKLLAEGISPAAIRLGLFASHYRADRDWSGAVVEQATEQVSTWGRALGQGGSMDDARQLVQQLRATLANDLNTPDALAAVDQWAHNTLAGTASEQEAGELVRTALHSLLGVVI